MRRSRSLPATAGRFAAWAAMPALLAGPACGSAVPQPHVSAALSQQVAEPPALGGTGIAPGGKPASTTGSAFQMALIHHYGAAANASGYSVIVATGPSQAWAFGGTNPGGPSAPIATLWNGVATTTATLPSGLGSFISDAGATSSTDVWAASQYGRYVLHFDGIRWRVARRWQHGQITGLTAVTPSDVWVFGTTADGASDIGTWHYDGASWQRVRGLAGSIVRASAVSGSDIWAIAVNRASYSILRFDGTSWTAVPAGSALDLVQPKDILAISARDVWVLGDLTATSGGVRLDLLHWNGFGWSSLVTGTNAWAGRLAAGPDDSVLATATPASASASGLVLQAAVADGRLVASVRSWLASGGVSDIALVDGANALWASGAVLTGVGGDAVIWAGQLAPLDDGLGA